MSESEGNDGQMRGAQASDGQGSSEQATGGADRAKPSGRKRKLFDVIIGNPPYQEESNDNGRQPPVYNMFMDAAESVAITVELIHPARFLFDAGQTPKAWNEKKLNDPHFKVLRYDADASTVFPNTEIKGG